MVWKFNYCQYLSFLSFQCNLHSLNYTVWRRGGGGGGGGGDVYDKV